MIVTMTTLNQHLAKLQESIEYARETNKKREYPYSIKKVGNLYQVYNGYYDDPQNATMTAGCTKEDEIYNTEAEARQAIYNHLIQSAEIAIKGYVWSGTDCC